MYSVSPNRTCMVMILFLLCGSIRAQQSVPVTLKKAQRFAGIEVGSKGVKLSVLDIGLNPARERVYQVIRDSSINSDFISFTPKSFDATLQALTGLYRHATRDFLIPPSRIYTVISSGVKVQSEKEHTEAFLTRLQDSFRIRTGNLNQQLLPIDVTTEARLSHLGIVPEARRYSTFLIDIGSGNTKGGYFPNGNTKDLRLFQLSWGTKSVLNATEKRSGEDRSAEGFKKNLNRVITGEAEQEIVYAVNVSNAYNMSDYIAFSGGISWATATLLFPELLENTVVPVRFQDVQQMINNLQQDPKAYSATNVVGKLAKGYDIPAITAEINRVNSVFDQRSLLAGASLLMQIMRQFEGVYEKKQFYLVKNGQVGWISSYVDEAQLQ